MSDREENKITTHHDITKNKTKFSHQKHIKEIRQMLKYEAIKK